MQLEARNGEADAAKPSRVVVRWPEPPDKPFLTAEEVLWWIAWGSTGSMAQFEGPLIYFWGQELSDELADAVAAGGDRARKVQALIQSKESQLIPLDQLGERLERDRAALTQKYEMLSRASSELIVACVDERLEGWARPDRRWEPKEPGEDVPLQIIPHDVFIQDGIAVTWMSTLEKAGRQIGHDVRFRRSDVLAQWPVMTDPPEAAPPKRKSNRLDYRAQDALLVADMHKAIQNGEARNAPDAARAFVKRAVGGGNDDSKVQRLLKRYREMYPTER
jgi:hypothetical protein